MLKKSYVGFLTILAVLGTGIPAISDITVHAADVSNQTGTTVPNNAIDSLTPEKIADTPSYMQLLRTNSSTVYDASSDTTTISITDFQMRNILSGLGFDQIDLGMLGLQRISGVTKVKFYGRKRSGNANVYLSASMLNRVKKSATSAAVSAIFALFAFPLGPVGGLAWGTINFASKQLVTAAIHANVNKFKAGRIFKVRSWKYKGWSYQ